jgi:uncharacterized protein YijF (DUF1287 family)
LQPAPVRRSSDPVFRGALAQLDSPARYDASYRRIGFPGGDVPPTLGACSDVVVRSLRSAGLDLQAAVQLDCRRTRYPGIARPDPNIDHRRVRNLEVYFRRHFTTLTTNGPPESWQPGDIVVWLMPTGRDHIGVVSDRRGRSGWPAVIHNTGRVAEQDVLQAWETVGHYRMPPVAKDKTRPAPCG